jgi:hypothetical protein
MTSILNAMTLDSNGLCIEPEALRAQTAALTFNQPTA